MQYQTNIDTLDDFYQSLYAIPARRTRNHSTPKTVTKALLQALGNPQQELHSVLITGSKGKGSSAIMLSNLLQAAGLKVGQFCSPHLFDFRERITVNGKMIEPNHLIKLAKQVFSAANHLPIKHPDEFPRFFEVTTAIAYLYFVKNFVDYAVIETGIGALTDATNQDVHELAVLTNIETEHLDIFGDLTAVATEKAGVIQPDKPLILGDLPENIDQLIMARANELNSPVTRFKRGSIKNNSGFFSIKVGQKSWIADSVTKAKNAWTDAEKVAALQQTYLPAREEIVSKTPLVIIDGAHTQESAHHLANYVEKSAPSAMNKLTLLVSFSAEKNIQPVLSAFPKTDKIVITQATETRSLTPEKIEKVIKKQYVYDDGVDMQLIVNPIVALKETMQQLQTNDVLVITGSVYLAGLLSQQFRL